MKYVSLLLIFVFTFFVLTNTHSAEAISSKKPFAGKIKIIPATKATSEKEQCEPNLRYCPEQADATAVSASWEYTIKEKRSFTLAPDMSPTEEEKTNFYYAPPSVKGTPNNKFAEGQYIKGFFTNKQQMEVGKCTCTYEQDSYPYDSYTKVNTAKATISKISLWGNSEE